MTQNIANFPLLPRPNSPSLLYWYIFFFCTHECNHKRAHWSHIDVRCCLGHHTVCQHQMLHLTKVFQPKDVCRTVRVAYNDSLRLREWYSLMGPLHFPCWRLRSIFRSIWSGWCPRTQAGTRCSTVPTQQSGSSSSRTTTETILY